MRTASCQQGIVGRKLQGGIVQQAGVMTCCAMTELSVLAAKLARQNDAEAQGI
jgi:hypothetical protein